MRSTATDDRHGRRSTASRRLAAVSIALLAVPLMGADCALDGLAESLGKACSEDLRVTTTDEDQDPGQPDAFFVCLPDACTLRDAIATANACGGAHDIVLPAAIYALSEPDRSSLVTPGASLAHDAEYGPVALPVITADIRIDAEGGDAGIARGEDTPAFRIFHVAEGGKLTLRSVTLVRGLTPNDGSGTRRQDGGAVLNQGFLTLEESRIGLSEAFRYGGGVANYGVLRSTGSIFLANRVDVPDWALPGSGGGALFNAHGAHATLEEDQLYRNLAGTSGHGGAIVNEGDLEISQSVLAENRAAASGGAIHTDGGNVRVAHSALAWNGTGGVGGALSAGTYTGSLSIQASTLSANYADDGSAIHYAGWGELSIDDSTIVYNEAPDGAALYLGDGTGRVTNSIIANAPTLIGTPAGWSGSIDCVMDGGAQEFSGLGIDSDGSCAPHYLTADPQLRPLADNGGATPTHALNWGSPALDGGFYCRTFDQRFEGRPRDGDGDGTATCDIGAFESQPGEIEQAPGVPFDIETWLLRTDGEREVVHLPSE